MAARLRGTHRGALDHPPSALASARHQADDPLHEFGQSGAAGADRHAGVERELLTAICAATNAVHRGGDDACGGTRFTWGSRRPKRADRDDRSIRAAIRRSRCAASVGLSLARQCTRCRRDAFDQRLRSLVRDRCVALDAALGAYHVPGSDRIYTETPSRCAAATRVGSLRVDTGKLRHG